MWTKPIAEELGVESEFTSEEIPNTVRYLLVSTYLHMYCTDKSILNTVKDIRENDWVFMDNYKLYQRWDLYDNIPKMRFNLGIFESMTNDRCIYKDVVRDICIIKVNNVCFNKVFTDINQIYCIVPYEIYNIKHKVLENLLNNVKNI